MVNKKSQSQRAVRYFLSIKLGNFCRTRVLGIRPSLSNKRGWLRILEASIGILLILGAIFVMNIQNKSSSLDDLSVILPSLLEELGKNTSFRDFAVKSGPIAVEFRVQNFLAERIQSPGLNYSVRVCSPNELCALPLQPRNLEGTVYAAEYIISGTNEQYMPKKIKIFLWREK